MVNQWTTYTDETWLCLNSIADRALVDRVFTEYKLAVVVNLAAQAGVRYSIDHPDVYIESIICNLYGQKA